MKHTIHTGGAAPVYKKAYRVPFSQKPVLEKLVQDQLDIGKPLFELTLKDSEFSWTENCQTAFENLKDKLVTAPFLALPVVSKQFMLASAYAVGAVLSQSIWGMNTLWHMFTGRCSLQSGIRAQSRGNS